MSSWHRRTPGSCLGRRPFSEISCYRWQLGMEKDAWTLTETLVWFSTRCPQPDCPERFCWLKLSPHESEAHVAPCGCSRSEFLSSQPSWVPGRNVIARTTWVRAELIEQAFFYTYQLRTGQLASCLEHSELGPRLGECAVLNPLYCFSNISNMWPRRSQMLPCISLDLQELIRQGYTQRRKGWGFLCYFVLRIGIQSGVLAVKGSL